LHDPRSLKEAPAPVSTARLRPSLIAPDFAVRRLRMELLARRPALPSATPPRVARHHRERCRSAPRFGHRAHRNAR